MARLPKLGSSFNSSRTKPIYVIILLYLFHLTTFPSRKKLEGASQYLGAVPPLKVFKKFSFSFPGLGCGLVS